MTAPTIETIESATARDVRHLLENWILVDMLRPRYFLKPGHPIHQVRKAAGRAGTWINGRQLRLIFGPHMPRLRVGKRYVPLSPGEVLRNAAWRVETVNGFT